MQFKMGPNLKITINGLRTKGVWFILATRKLKKWLYSSPVLYSVSGVLDLVLVSSNSVELVFFW